MKSIKFLLRLPPDVDLAVRKIAENTDRSVSWTINDLLKQAITPEMLDPARADELAIVLDSLANRAATMKDQEIIKGKATDIALRESQAWYQDQKAAAEKKYA